MNIDHVRKRLATHEPQMVALPGMSQAAVAIVLRERQPTAEFIAIHRAERHGDPWSGHMALPGGRHQAGDADLAQTVARETCEEVGVDLSTSADLLGSLDDVQAVGSGKLLPLVIRPYVFALRHDVTLRPNAEEVQAAIWVPMLELRDPARASTLRREVSGLPQALPAWTVQGYTIWGLTHRILSGMLALLD
jgi:8-oxo-dGTP pyrophosphatase MutT (NUDIX family)